MPNTNTCYYLAYGSNLHPLRLNERIPSSIFLDVVELKQYRLEFHKYCTHDGSGKCNLLFTGHDKHNALAAIFAMDVAHKPILDEFEGIGYEVVTDVMSVTGQEREVFWYQAIDDFIDNTLQPYHWYQQIVLMGAEFHQFPKSYQQHVKSFISIEDPDPERHRDRFDLISRMKQYANAES